MSALTTARGNAAYYASTGRTGDDVIAGYWQREAERIERGEPYACAAHYLCRGGLVGCVVNGVTLIPGCDR